MPRNSFAGIAAAMTVLLFTTPLQAQTPTSPQAAAENAEQSIGAVKEREKVANLEQQSQEAYEAGQWVAFYAANMKLLRLRPYEQRYLVNTVRACGLLDKKSTAYHQMLLMQQQGMAYDFNTTDDTLPIRETEAYEYINKLLVEAGQSSGVATEAFTLKGVPADFQAIAWDESRKEFLVGTAGKGEVLAVSAGGKSRELLKADDENGLWSITGLAVDAGRNRLWLTSAATPRFTGFTPADKNHSALFEYNLETLEQVGRYNFPVDGLKHEAGSLALSDDGHVYVIDRATPIIYRKNPGGDRLEPFFASRDLIGLNDIAVAPDNSRIFVSDVVKGILVIDPVGEDAAMLTGPETMNLGGITGVDYRDGKLFVMQGGFNPPRVVRLQLDAVSGAIVESISPMAIALDGFNRPGWGTINDENLYYFANTGEQDKSRLIVMSTPLDAGVEVEPPGMEDFEKAVRSQSQ